MRLRAAKRWWRSANVHQKRSNKTKRVIGLIA